MLLLGKHRGPEGAVVHTEHRVHVTAVVPHAFGHGEPVAVRLGSHRRVRSRDRPAHEVDVALVLEGDLSDALAVRAGRRDLLLGGPGLAPKSPEHRFEQGRLAGAVRSVHADKPRWQHEVELVFEYAVVA